MQSSRHPVAIIRFGSFEVDPGQRVLRRNGLHIKLQSQPFHVLATLLEKPGIPVTRDELRRRIWPEDTFVDFEHGLNAAVTRLRRALGDSANNPRYIQTLPKYGYRFCGQVEQEAVESTPVQVAAPVRAAKGRVAFAAAAIAVFAGVAVSVPRLWRSPAEQPVQVGRPAPLTSFPGREDHPALSPDGSQVAFTWDGEKQKNLDIYVLRIGSTTPIRLTFDEADDLSPAWSPDGNTIAFVRRISHNSGKLLLIPAAGGPEHQVHNIYDQELRDSPARLLSLSWSPNGQWIAASHRAAEDAAERIYLFSVAGEARPLTSRPSAYGDHTPAFSPDGRALAFTRLAGYSASEIAWLPLDADCRPVDEARHLTRGKWSAKPAWTRDGSGIMYLSGGDPGARQDLRIVALSGGKTTAETPVPLNDEVAGFALGRHLVYSRQVGDTDIKRARISAPGTAPVAGEVLISSTWRDGKPRYSPDGSKIAFTSYRSGSPELWVSKSDGSHAVRITSFGGPLVGWANWSPDGQWLLFHARPEGQADLFVIPAAGGTPKRLTTDSADDALPSYSRDGRWIYFSSTRSGREQVWRMPAEGGEAVQLTNSSGGVALESADGKRIFYISEDGSTILSVPVSGGKSTPVLGPVDDYMKAMAVTASGIYYPAPSHSPHEHLIWFFSFSTRKSRPIAKLRDPFGLSVSPDSKYVLFDDRVESGSDLMLVNHFGTK